MQDAKLKSYIVKKQKCDFGSATLVLKLMPSLKLLATRD